MARKLINERFFDIETEAMWYVKGAFYSSYIPQPNNGILFRSSHRDLVQIVKDQLESEHAIISDPRGKSSHWIVIEDVPYLNSRLGEMGLNAPKTERRFPEDVPEDYLSQFVRGFLEGRAYIIKRYDKLTVISISFNNPFLAGLHNILMQYSGVTHDEPSGNRLVYGHKDSLKIHDFIYQDWDYLPEHGLYLPSKKGLFITDYPGDHSNHPNKIAAQNRIIQGKILLLDGMSGIEVSKKLGYLDPSKFYNAFKRETGQTTREWKKENIPGN